MKETLIIRITGKVQGVYFRQTAHEKATDLGITGYVRNMPDGSVEMTITGDADKLRTIVEWCHTGPKRAHVEKVMAQPVPLQEFDRFDIRRN